MRVQMFSFSDVKMGIIPFEVIDVCEKLRDVIPCARNLIMVANSTPTLSSILNRRMNLTNTNQNE